MENSNIIYCLEVLQSSIETLETSGDLEMVLDNLNFVSTLILSINPEFGRAASLLDFASTLIESVAVGENVHQSLNVSAVGRPKLTVSARSLEFLLSLNFNVPTISSVLGVSKRTIHRRLAESNLSISRTYSIIDDDELDSKVSVIVLNHPNTGYKRMKGFLLETGIKVTEQRILQSLRRVDPIGVDERRSQNRAIYRRTYFVQYSMELWHIDTHHKLIRYGIVVRGGIDGKSRSIVFLDVGADNTAGSNFESFMEGVHQYGAPIRTRSDKGGENVDIARFMLETRGTGRGSHICGRSVHNQRIERLWRDVHYGCLSFYRYTFIQLEDMGYFNIDNPFQVAVLQRVFIPRIRRSLLEFTAAWNRHVISGEHGRTPLQLMYLNLPPSAMDIIVPPAPVEAVEEFLINNDADLQQFQFERIDVEDYQSTLSYHQLELLNGLDVLRPSNQFGADIFIEAINLLSRE